MFQLDRAKLCFLIPQNEKSSSQHQRITEELRWEWISGSLWSNPSSSRATQIRELRTMSRWVLKISGKGDCSLSWQPVPVLSHPSSKTIFHDIETEPPVFQLGLNPSCPVTGHHYKGPGSVLFAPSFQITLYINKIPCSYRSLPPVRMFIL